MVLLSPILDFDEGKYSLRFIYLLISQFFCQIIIDTIFVNWGFEEKVSLRFEWVTVLENLV